MKIQIDLLNHKQSFYLLLTFLDKYAFSMPTTDKHSIYQLKVVNI